MGFRAHANRCLRSFKAMSESRPVLTFPLASMKRSANFYFTPIEATAPTSTRSVDDLDWDRRNVPIEAAAPTSTRSAADLNWDRQRHNGAKDVSCLSISPFVLSRHKQQLRYSTELLMTHRTSLEPRRPATPPRSPSCRHPRGSFVARVGSAPRTINVREAPTLHSASSQVRIIDSSAPHIVSHRQPPPLTHSASAPSLLKAPRPAAEGSSPQSSSPQLDDNATRIVRERASALLQAGHAAVLLVEMAPTTNSHGQRPGDPSTSRWCDVYKYEACWSELVGAFAEVLSPDGWSGEHVRERVHVSATAPLTLTVPARDDRDTLPANVSFTTANPCRTGAFECYLLIDGAAGRPPSCQLLHSRLCSGHWPDAIALRRRCQRALAPLFLSRLQKQRQRQRQRQRQGAPLRSATEAKAAHYAAARAAEAAEEAKAQADEENSLAAIARQDPRVDRAVRLIQRALRTHQDKGDKRDKGRLMSSRATQRRLAADLRESRLSRQRVANFVMSRAVLFLKNGSDVSAADGPPDGR